LPKFTLFNTELHLKLKNKKKEYKKGKKNKTKNGVFQHHHLKTEYNLRCLILSSKVFNERYNTKVKQTGGGKDKQKLVVLTI